MKEKIRPGSVQRNKIVFDQLSYKFILYSAHDDNQAWLLHILKPENMKLDFIPYASTFLFELH